MRTRFRLCLDAFLFRAGGGQLIDAHAHTAKGGKQGDAVCERLYLTRCGCHIYCVPWFIIILCMNLCKVVGVALGKMSSVANLLTLPNERLARPTHVLLQPEAVQCSSQHIHDSLSPLVTLISAHVQIMLHAFWGTWISVQQCSAYY